MFGPQADGVDAYAKGYVQTCDESYVQTCDEIYSCDPPDTGSGYGR